MNNLFQLRNKFSNRILTDHQQKNTKGRGKGDIGKNFGVVFEETMPISPASPSNNTPSNSGPKKFGPQRPSGPPQFVPGGSSPFGVPTI